MGDKATLLPIISCFLIKEHTRGVSRVICDRTSVLAIRQLNETVFTPAIMKYMTKKLIRI